MIRALQRFAADNKQTLFKMLSSTSFDSGLDACLINKLKQCIQEACDQYFTVFPDPLDFAGHKNTI